MTTGSGKVNIANLISSSAIQKELGLPAAKISELRRKMMSENLRLKQEIARLTAEARQNVLSVLDESEQEKVSQLIGEPFDFQGFRPGRGGRFTNQKDH